MCATNALFMQSVNLGFFINLARPLNNNRAVFMKMGFGNADVLPHLHACVWSYDRIAY